MSWLRKKNEGIDHQYVTDRLSTYLDGELSPQERKAVHQHLDGCQACQWQLDTLRQTVQWTRELPTIPVPRVFTIPPLTQPVPVAAPRRRRSFVPLLQGATALLALLLVFVVASDVMLSSILPAAAPPAAGMPELAPAAVEVTQVVQVMEKALQLESDVAVEETTSQAAPPTEGQRLEQVKGERMEGADVLPTPTPEGGRIVTQGTRSQMDKHTGAAGETNASEAPSPSWAGATVTEREAILSQAPAADEVKPTLAVIPTVPPPEPATVVEPTTIVGIQEPTAVAFAAQAERPAGALRQPSVPWLRLAEFGLGTAFVLLATITIVATIRRRRTR